MTGVSCIFSKYWEGEGHDSKGGKGGGRKRDGGRRGRGGLCKILSRAGGYCDYIL